MLGHPAGSSTWLVALAEGAELAVNEVVRGACTLQVLQGQVRVRRARQRSLTVFPGDLLELSDAGVRLHAATDTALMVTGEPCHTRESHVV